MFSTTHWTVVFRAAKEKSDAGRPALSSIMQKYWHPLYAFARQRGLSAADAEDATQSFLTEIMQGDLLANADPARGRFRNYLLSAWERFLIDLHRSERAQKRGGAVSVCSIDATEGESQWKAISKKADAPERVYLVTWANSIAREAIARLQKEYDSSHRKVVFDQLLPYLTVPTDKSSYAEISKKLLVQEGAAKVALHRLRQRFAQTLRSVIGETIDNPAELEAELAELIQVLASPESIR